MARKRSSKNGRLLLILLLGFAAYYAVMEFRKRRPAGDERDLNSAVVTNLPTNREPDNEETDGPTPETRADGKSGIEVFFSSTYRNDPSVGAADAANIDRRLASFIAGARKSLDCAFYELESQRIADALIGAHDRGIRVRVVGDADYKGNEEMKAVIAAGIPVVFDERGALMHNKFVVVDGVAVWTGSFNATDNCAFRNNNNAVEIRSAELAENYAREFAEMFDRKEFGPRSASNTPHSLVRIGEAEIYNYFSPEDDVPPKIIRYLKAARKSIHFMAFSFSDDAMGDVLMAKKREGIDVQGVVESRGAGSAHSELVRLQPAGVDVRKDGNRFVMHHKVFIIDGVWTITGSYNFSASAATQNDENVLIIKDQGVARRFEEEYKRIRGMAEPSI